VLILIHRTCQNRIANLFGLRILMLTDHLFYLKADLFVAAILDQVCVHDKDVSRTHQSNLRHVG
jgi:hypothetical protein